MDKVYIQTREKAAMKIETENKMETKRPDGDVRGKVKWSPNLGSNTDYWLVLFHIIIIIWKNNDSV